MTTVQCTPFGSHLNDILDHTKHDECKKDFLSVLEQFHYKGSLVQTFETDKMKSINPLPPITGVFNLHQPAELNTIVDSQYPNKG